MHAALLQDGNVVFLDKVETYTEMRLDKGRYAFSSIFNPSTQQLHPLDVHSNAFCSAGAFLADGRLISVGGNGELKWLDPHVGNGLDAIRYLDLKATNKAWLEPGNKLHSNRWYATTQALADGSIFTASGSLNALDVNNHSNNNPTYEILDKEGMYPFLHLLKDGTLFVFVSKSSQIFDVAKNKPIKAMPDLKGMYRTYPNTGGSVMLPLTKTNNYDPTIMICGGGGWQGIDSPGEASCGSISPMSNNPQWRYTSMPEGRCMVEGVILLDGTVLWINGAQRGAQGFGIADKPAFEALIYNPADNTWAEAGRSVIPRLYHSVALMLLDGTILIAGSNPNEMPVIMKNVEPANQYKKFPTEFRMEKWTPPYLVGVTAERRPFDIHIDKLHIKANGMEVHIKFRSTKNVHDVKVMLYHGGFVTHALHMGQVMVELHCTSPEEIAGGFFEITTEMPKISLAPGPYVVYVMVNGVPGMGQFVSLSS